MTLQHKSKDSTSAAPSRSTPHEGAKSKMDKTTNHMKKNKHASSIDSKSKNDETMPRRNNTKGTGVNSTRKSRGNTRSRRVTPGRANDDAVPPDKSSTNKNKGTKSEMDKTMNHMKKNKSSIDSKSKNNETKPHRNNTKGTGVNSTRKSRGNTRPRRVAPGRANDDAVPPDKSSTNKTSSTNKKEWNQCDCHQESSSHNRDEEQEKNTCRGTRNHPIGPPVTLTTVTTNSTDAAQNMKKEANTIPQDGRPTVKSRTLTTVA